MDPNQMTNMQPQGTLSPAAGDGSMIGGDELKKKLIERFVAEGSTLDAAVARVDKIFSENVSNTPPAMPATNDPKYISAEEVEENQTIANQIIQKAYEKMMITSEKELTAREVLSHAFQETKQRPMKQRTQAALDALNRFVALNKKFDQKRTQKQGAQGSNTVNPFAAFHQSNKGKTPTPPVAQSMQTPVSKQPDVTGLTSDTTPTPPIAPTPTPSPTPAASAATSLPSSPPPVVDPAEESIPNIVKKPTFAETPAAAEPKKPTTPEDTLVETQKTVPLTQAPATPPQQTPPPATTQQLAQPTSQQTQQPVASAPVQSGAIAPPSVVDPGIETIRQKVATVTSKDEAFFAKYVSEQIEVAMAVISRNEQLPSDMIAGIKDTLVKSANAIASEKSLSVSDRVQKLDVLFQQYRKEYAQGNVADHIPTDTTISELLKVAESEVNTGNAENDTRFRVTLQNALNNKVRQMQDMGVAVSDIHPALHEEYERMKKFYLTPA